MGATAHVTLRGGGLVLKPIMPPDHPFLYDLATSEENLILWRYRGAVPAPEVFVAQLYADVLVQFIVRLESTGEPIGMVVAYSPNLQSGHVHLGAVMTTPARGRMMGAMAMEIFIQYLFDVWNLHGIFAEIPEYTQDAMMERRQERNAYLPFVETGRRPKFYYFKGRFWDDCITYLSREAWDSRTGSLTKEAKNAV